MSSSFGNYLKISIFGESHSKAIGMTIDGLKAGLPIDELAIESALNDRRPDGKLSSTRIEDDKVVFLSGLFNGFTTGSPLTFIIENKDTKSEDYDKSIIRPSHSDYTAYIKNSGFNDYRGGGFTSGRVTASLVVLGVICKSLLEKHNVNVVSHILNIHGVEDERFNSKINEQVKKIIDPQFPTINEIKSVLMKKEIQAAKDEGDSVGGIIETAILNCPIGLGEPYFDSFESTLSHLLFSLGGVKGVSFGDGFDFVSKKGSEVKDEMRVNNGKVSFLSNHNGGILGGITNGNVITFQTAIKPTPSIYKEMQSVNLNTNENVNLALKGRFDPCFVQRVRPVIDALSYYALVELLMANESKNI